jgi:hypothetical protein
MRDGLHWANRFAGVATNAYLWVDEMLLDDCCIHISGLFKKTNAAALGRDKRGGSILIEAHVLKISRLAVDADVGR